MEVIKKGFILNEEKALIHQAKFLPDSWLCIGGDANRIAISSDKAFQVDFIVICPYGVFLIDAKNIARIVRDEKTSDIYFLNKQGNKVSKNSKRINPVEEAIHLRYQVKDWLSKRPLEGLFTFFDKKKNLNFFLHGLVVLLNSENVEYQNLQWEDISYTQYKNPTLISLQQFTLDYFESLKPPPFCKKLTNEEMWFLFELFYRPDFKIVDFFSYFRSKENHFFNEKKVFIEKINLLESENESFQEKSRKLEASHDYFLEELELLKKEKSSLIEKQKSQEEKIKTLIEKDKEIQNSYQQIQDQYIKSEQEKAKINEELDIQKNEKKLFEKEIHLLKKEKNRQNFLKNIYQLRYLIASIFLGTIFFLGFFINYNFFSKKQNYQFQSLSLIEKYYFTIESLFQEQKYNEILDLWQNEVIKNNELESNLLSDYNMIFYYIALCYEKKKDFINSIKYHNIFIQLAKDPNELIMAYYKKGLAYIKMETSFDKAIYNLKKAKEINENYLNSSYPLKVHIPFHLGRVYEVISSLKTQAKKDYSQLLKEKDFFKKSLYFYNDALKKTDQKDFDNKIEIQANIAHLYFVNTLYKKAIKEFKNLIELIQKQSNLSKYTEKMIAAENGLAVSYSFFQNFNLAEKYYLQTIKTISQLTGSLAYKQDYYYAQIFLNLGSMYLNQNRYLLAIENLKKSYELAEKLKLPNLNRFLKKLKDAETLYQKKFNSLKDTIQ